MVNTASAERVFVVGDVVQSRVSAQGLVLGRQYTVTHVYIRRTFMGEFMTLTVVCEPGAEGAFAVPHNVGNPHLVFDWV